MAKITASKILEGARKAQPFNFIRLADPELYDMVPYGEFFSAIVGHPKKDLIEELLIHCKKIESEVPQEYVKTYIYFLLSLHEIVYEG